MKLWKSSLVFVSMGILLLSSFTVSAVTEQDMTGDVVHATWANNVWGYADVGTKSNIDITDVSADISNGKLTLSLTVVGPVVQSENYAYVVWFNTSDANYTMIYSGFGGQQTGISLGIPKNIGDYQNMSTGTVSLEGTTTLRTTLNVSGSDTTKLSLYGTAYEYTGNPSENQYGEYWADVAGDYTDFQHTPSNGEPPGNGNNTDGGSKGTPGFELVALLSAAAIAFVLLRRRR